MVDIESLDARLQTLEATQMASTVNVNDSAVSRTRELLNEIGKKVAIKQKLVDGMGQLDGLITIETTPEVDANVTAQIDQYFGGKSSVEGLTKAETTLNVQPVSSSN